MTRQEFIDNVTSWAELIEFCNDEGLDNCNNVYDDESYNDKIDEELVRRAEDELWQDVREWLDNLPDGYDYYIIDAYGDWSGVDEFDLYRDEVIEYMDDCGSWDEDEYDEEEPEEYIDPEDEDPVEEEGVTLAELFTICSSQVQKLENDKIRDASAAELEEVAAFDELFVSSGITVTVEGSI